MSDKKMMDDLLNEFDKMQERWEEWIKNPIKIDLKNTKQTKSSNS